MKIKLLIPNRLKIVSFVEAYPWPKILNGALQIPDTNIYNNFVKLSDQHFIMATPTWIYRCVHTSEHCFSSSVPLRITTDKAPCVVSQFYDVIHTNCQYKTLKSKLFFMLMNDSLIYTVLGSIEVKINCQNSEGRLKIMWKANLTNSKEL